MEKNIEDFLKNNPKPSNEDLVNFLASLEAGDASSKTPTAEKLMAPGAAKYESPLFQPPIPVKDNTSTTTLASPAVSDSPATVAGSSDVKIEREKTPKLQNVKLDDLYRYLKYLLIFTQEHHSDNSPVTKKDLEDTFKIHESVSTQLIKKLVRRGILIKEGGPINEANLEKELGVQNPGEVWHFEGEDYKKNPDTIPVVTKASDATVVNPTITVAVSHAPDLYKTTPSTAPIETLSDQITFTNKKLFEILKESPDQAIDAEYLSGKLKITLELAREIIEVDLKHTGQSGQPIIRNDYTVNTDELEKVGQSLFKDNDLDKLYYLSALPVPVKTTPAVATSHTGDPYKTTPVLSPATSVTPATNPTTSAPVPGDDLSSVFKRVEGGATGDPAHTTPTPPAVDPASPATDPLPPDFSAGERPDGDPTDPESLSAAERLKNFLVEKYKNTPKVWILATAMALGTGAIGLSKLSNTEKSQTSPSASAPAVKPPVVVPPKAMEKPANQGAVSPEIINKNYQETTWWKYLNEDVQKNINLIINAKSAEDYSANFFRSTDGKFYVEDYNGNPIEITADRFKMIFGVAKNSYSLLNAAYFGVEKTNATGEPYHVQLQECLIKVKSANAEPSGPDTTCYTQKQWASAAATFHKIGEQMLGWSKDSRLLEGRNFIETYDLNRKEIIKFVNANAK